MAAIPNNGVIHGCYKKDTGALRVYDSVTKAPKPCTDKKTQLDWNAQGGGPSKAYARMVLGAQVPANAPTIVAERTVPPGAYVLSAKLYSRPRISTSRRPR